jgi:hypothetical protein
MQFMNIKNIAAMLAYGLQFHAKLSGRSYVEKDPRKVDIEI